MSVHVFTIKLLEDVGLTTLVTPKHWEVSITLSDPVTPEDLTKAFNAFLQLYEAEE